MKLIGSAILALSLLALSGCYDVGPYPGGYGGYGYGGGPAAYSEPAFAPGYAGGYGGLYPGYSGFYPGGYYGGHYFGHDGWDHDHWAVPEHRGFIGHDYPSRGSGRGFAVAHNEGFHGGFHGGELHGGAAAFHGAGGGFHGVGGTHGASGHSNSGRR